MPKIDQFLELRGLNMERTPLVSIQQGFDFVFHFREYFDKGRIKGSKQGIFLVTPTKISITELKD